GPVCEAMLNGKYYWIPFERLSRIDVEAPSDLRDLIWAPAKLTFQNGGEQVAFLPARYPGSEAVEDDEIRLSRKTEWRDLGADTHVGLGQRMFATDVGETALLEARVIELKRESARHGGSESRPDQSLASRPPDRRGSRHRGRPRQFDHAFGVAQERAARPHVALQYHATL